MGKRIYVGNLPWSVTKAKLEELFSSFGEIEDALVVANKYTGRSRGFGFVTFKKEHDADKAIKEMDQNSVEGRNLVVKEARPMEERKPPEKRHREHKEEHRHRKEKRSKKEPKEENFEQETEEFS